MKTTNSLIFIPDKSSCVKKSMMMGNFNSSNPLLRNINLKDKKKYLNINNTHASALSQREENVRPKRSGSGRTYVKNMTGGPILISIPGELDDRGHPKCKAIYDYMAKDQISLLHLSEFEVESLYNGGKLSDISEDEYHDEISRKKKDKPKQQAKTRKDFHDLETVRSQEKYVEAGGKQIKITEDLYSGHGNTEEFQVEEGTRLDRHTELLMGGGISLDDGVEDLIPGGGSYRSRRSAPAPPREKSESLAYSRPVVSSDPEKQIRRS